MKDAQAILGFIDTLGRTRGSEGQKACQEFFLACLTLLRKRVRAFTDGLRGERGILNPEPEATEVRETACRVLALASSMQAIPSMFRTAEQDPLDPSIGSSLRDLALYWTADPRSSLF